MLLSFLAFLFAQGSRETGLAETQVLSGRFLLLKFAAILARIIGRLAEAALEADGALAFYHQSVSPAFPAVSAGALDGAGMLVLLAMVALEGFGALADVFIFACGSGVLGFLNLSWLSVLF